MMLLTRINAINWGRRVSISFKGGVGGGWVGGWEGVGSDVTIPKSYETSLF